MRPLDPEVKAALEQHGLTVSEETWGRFNGAGLESHSKAEFPLALAQFECAIALARHLFGDDDRRTLTSGNNLAEALHSNGRVLEAITMHEDTLRERRRVLGADDYDTLMSRNNLACALKANGQLQQALTTFKECLSEHERVYGQDDPRTQLARQNLARIMSSPTQAVESSDAQESMHATAHDIAATAPVGFAIIAPNVPPFTPKLLEYDTFTLIVERAMSLEDPGDQCLLLAREMASRGATRDACVALLACCAFYAATSRIMPGALAVTLRDCGRLLLDTGYPEESRDAFDLAGQEFERIQMHFSASPLIRNCPNWNLARAISDLGLACAQIECGDVAMGSDRIAHTLKQLFHKHRSETRAASLCDQTTVANIVLRSGHMLTKHVRHREVVVQLELLDALELSIQGADAVNLESLRCTCLLYMRSSDGLADRLRALRERLPQDSVWRRARVTLQLAQALALQDRYADAASEFALARRLMPRVADEDLMEYLSLVIPLCTVLGVSKADMAPLVEQLSKFCDVTPVTVFNVLAMCHGLMVLSSGVHAEAAVDNILKRLLERSVDLMEVPPPLGWERACLEMLRIKSSDVRRKSTDEMVRIMEGVARHATSASASMSVSHDQATRFEFLILAAQQLRRIGKHDESRRCLQKVLCGVSQIVDGREAAGVRDAAIIGLATVDMDAGRYGEAARWLNEYLERAGSRIESIDASVDWIAARQVLMVSEAYVLLATCYAKLGNDTGAWQALEYSASQGVDELLACSKSGDAMKRTPLPRIASGEVLLRVSWTRQVLLVGILGPSEVFAPRVIWSPIGEPPNECCGQRLMLEHDQCWSEISTLSFLISAACGGEQVDKNQMERALQALAVAAQSVESDSEAVSILLAIRDELARCNRGSCNGAPEAARIECSADCIAMMSRRLLKVLLPDAVRGRLSAASRISVIAGGPLCAVPLSLAAELGDCAELAGKAITSVPSASIFTLLRERGVNSYNAGVGLVGDPDFREASGPCRQTNEPNAEGSDASESRVLLRDGSRTHRRLPRSGSESTLIASYVLERRTRAEPILLLGAGATVAAVEALAPGKHILHLSTHAVLGGMSDPLGSAVVLAAEELPDGTRKTGLLRLERLLTHWGDCLASCDLVVLSCCQTGRGVRVGDSLMALPIGFLHAGARSVLATLWPVGDLTTCLIMMRFYQNYLGTHRDDLGRPETRGREVWHKSYQPGESMPIPQALADSKRWVREMTMKQLLTIVEYVLPPLQNENDRARESLWLQRMVRLLGLSGRPFAHPHHWAAFTIIGDA